jgi:hypothetical protein
MVLELAAASFGPAEREAVNGDYRPSGMAVQVWDGFAAKVGCRLRSIRIEACDPCSLLRSGSECQRMGRLDSLCLQLAKLQTRPNDLQPFDGSCTESALIVVGSQ